MITSVLWSAVMCINGGTSIGIGIGMGKYGKVKSTVHWVGSGQVGTEQDRSGRTSQFGLSTENTGRVRTSG